MSLQPSPHEDFFTKLSFSALIRELDYDSDQLMQQQIALPRSSPSSVKIEQDL
jgi:hypothetical protein